jgi:hypothetical protein
LLENNFQVPMASLIGSADPRLEFYHIDCPDVNGQSPGMKNVGIVYIEAGEISKEELAKEFLGNIQDIMALADKAAG